MKSLNHSWDSNMYTNPRTNIRRLAQGSSAFYKITTIFLTLGIIKNRYCYYNFENYKILQKFMNLPLVKPMPREWRIVKVVWVLCLVKIVITSPIIEYVFVNQKQEIAIRVQGVHIFLINKFVTATWKQPLESYCIIYPHKYATTDHPPDICKHLSCNQFVVHTLSNI